MNFSIILKRRLASREAGYFPPPTYHLIYTLFIYQQYLQCRAALVWGWVKREDEGDSDVCVDGWEVGNKSGAVQWCSAIWREAHFSCVVRPHTGWVIRATHLPPQRQAQNKRNWRRRALYNCLLSLWYPKALHKTLMMSSWSFFPSSFHPFSFFTFFFFLSISLTSSLPFHLVFLPFILSFLLSFQSFFPFFFILSFSFPPSLPFYLVFLNFIPLFLDFSFSSLTSSINFSSHLPIFSFHLSSFLASILIWKGRVLLLPVSLSVFSCLNHVFPSFLSFCFLPVSFVCPFFPYLSDFFFLYLSSSSFPQEYIL